jgi:hypothetical protein
MPALDLARPYGTPSYRKYCPSDKSLGYFRMSLRDKSKLLWLRLSRAREPTTPIGLSFHEKLDNPEGSCEIKTFSDFPPDSGSLLLFSTSEVLNHATRPFAGSNYSFDSCT